MRNISILLAIIISIPIFSCGDAQMNTEYENWFGYYSRYTGQTNHAYYNGYTDAEVMAKKVVEAINLSKKLYRTSVTALIPPIFLDNYTTYMDQDNGTCLTNWGWREYNSSLSGQSLPLKIILLNVILIILTTADMILLTVQNVRL